MELSPLPLVLLLISNIHSGHTEEIPKPTQTVKPQSSVFTGDTITLNCEVDQSTEWEFLWTKDSDFELFEASGTKTISSVKVSDGGQYKCRARRRENIHVLTDYSEPLTVTVEERPKAKVIVQPHERVLVGETVTLRCDIQEGGDTSWQYSWYKDDSVIEYKLQEYTINSVTESNAGKYRCNRKEIGGSRYSHSSDEVTLRVLGLKPKPELKSNPEGAALTGNTVTLTCHMDQSTGWQFYWYQHTQKHQKNTTDKNSYTVNIDSVSDGGQYWCRAGRGNPVYYTHYSDALWVNVTDQPKTILTVKPENQLFSGETVTLRCDIQGGGDTEWTYSWTVENTNYRNKYIVSEYKKQEYKISSVEHTHSGKYTCRGKTRGGQNSEISDAVTLTVSNKAQAVLSVSPQKWLTEGDSVTLICEVYGSSTGWTFSWYRDDNEFNYKHLSDSSRGAGGNYTVSSAAVNHTGVYACRGERGEQVYYTEDSNTQPLWVTGVSPSVSLIISPNRTQHFTSDSLTLSCEDQSNSTGWTVRRYTDIENMEDCSLLSLSSSSSSSYWGSQTGSTCRISSVYTSHTGVYWCYSESGDNSNAVNITVHNGDVILESPVHPVTEGDSLTLRCLYRYKNPSVLTADFYKDGSLLQKQTTGEMIIPTVSKSHEGFYYCKHTERGESPKSWISVRVQISVLNMLSSLLAACPYLLLTVIMVFKCCRVRGKTSVSFPLCIFFPTNTNTQHYIVGRLGLVVWPPSLVELGTCMSGT
ncbi:Fc receptor-like protein 4 isoform X2 [Myxocyprinus asiaticus]|uniref:Fc receptor-like protein 4 isoform X2 n=1 Tax=Myxocyprinus asiaticus TaxID=70543 RepID=UPI002222DB12|nr:Fc receptor-like protein 4 isoform X2 [Myxocyprinus asiaticus]